MAVLGLIFIGLLFGLLLAGLAVGFIVVRSGGPVKESLFGADGRLPALGRKAPASAAEPSHGDTGQRHKAMLEEMRVLQRLVDQGQVERQRFAAERQALEADLAKRQQQLVEREARIEELTTAVAEARQRHDQTLALLGARTDEVSRLSVELKDLRTELDVAESGTAVTTSQVARLQQERDQLAELLEQYRGTARNLA